MRAVKCPRCGFRGRLSQFPVGTPDGKNFYNKCPVCGYKWLWGQSIGKQTRLDDFARGDRP